MKEEINQRFSVLVKEGEDLLRRLPRYEGELKYWVSEDDIHVYQNWITSVENLLRIAAGHSSHFVQECESLRNDKEMGTGIPRRVFQRFLGLITSARSEWENGFLREIEYVIAAATFDDFLDHAESYHRGNKKIESSVLASAVLEDTVKKIARKNGIDPQRLSLEQVIDELVKQDIWTLVKVKRVKSYAGVRNHALHAEWANFDIKDVGGLISGLRELIEEYL